MSVTLRKLVLLLENEIDGLRAMKTLFLIALLACAAHAQSPYENLTPEQIMARNMTLLSPGL